MVMSSEDYLLRQIRQMGEFLARLVGLREKGQYQKALDEIDQQLADWTGLTLAEVDQLDGSAFNKLIHCDTGNEAYLSGLAELVFQKVVLLIESAEYDSAACLAPLSLSLYQQIDQYSESYSLEIKQRISQLKTLISGA